MSVLFKKFLHEVLQKYEGSGKESNSESTGLFRQKKWRHFFWHNKWGEDFALILTSFGVFSKDALPMFLTKPLYLLGHFLRNNSKYTPIFYRICYEELTQHAAYSYEEVTLQHVTSCFVRHSFPLLTPPIRNSVGKFHQTFGVRYQHQQRCFWSFCWHQWKISRCR